MNKSKIIVFSLLAFLLLFSKNVLADTYISSCQELNQSGETYYLTQDIINSGISKCIEITANNIVFDCQGHTIDGDDSADYGIYINQVTNITLQNCNVTDWGNANIYMNGVDHSILENITSFSSPDYGIFSKSSDYNIFTNITSNNNFRGIYFEGSNHNILINITTDSNFLRGIHLYNSYFNTFTNIIISNTYGSYNIGFHICSYSAYNVITNALIFNNEDGIYIDETTSNTFTNITASNNSVGLKLYFSSSNIVNNSIFKNNSVGIYLYSSGSYGANKIYNCLLNNTNNIVFSGLFYLNIWNTTKQLGTRIYSNGNYIGGNYYTNPSGNGYSDTCEDSDYDGFCDNPYILADNNIDYLPLTFIKEDIFINSPQQNKIYVSGNLTLSGTVTLESNITYSLDNGTNQTICTECTEFDTQFYSPKGEHTICVYAITTDGSQTDSECINYTSANTILQEYPISIVVLFCSILSLLYYTLRINLIEKPIDLVRFIISLIVLIAVAITLLFGAFNSPLFV